MKRRNFQVSKAVGGKWFSSCVLTFWSFSALSGMDKTSNNTTCVRCLPFPHPGFLHCSVPPTASKALAEIQIMRNMANRKVVSHFNFLITPFHKVQFYFLCVDNLEGKKSCPAKSDDSDAAVQFWSILVLGTMLKTDIYWITNSKLFWLLECIILVCSFSLGCILARVAAWLPTSS